MLGLISSRRVRLAVLSVVLASGAAPASSLDRDLRGTLVSKTSTPLRISLRANEKGIKSIDLNYGPMVIDLPSSGWPMPAELDGVPGYEFDEAIDPSETLESRLRFFEIDAAPAGRDRPSAQVRRRDRDEYRNHGWQVVFYPDGGGEPVITSTDPTPTRRSDSRNDTVPSQLSVDKSARVFSLRFYGIAALAPRVSTAGYITAVEIRLKQIRRNAWKVEVRTVPAVWDLDLFTRRGAFLHTGTLRAR